MTDAVTRRILVVDDDPVALLMARLVLERAGHVVVDAPGVDEALVAIQQATTTEQPFDLTLCDYRMERIGLDLLDLRPTNEPFVLLTGEAEAEDLGDPRVARVAAVLTKPASSSELLAVVDELTTTRPTVS